MNLQLDDLPYTGATNYKDLADRNRIQDAAISTNGAEILSKLLKENPNGKLYFKQSCQLYDDVLSYNVVGGHLDSCDLGNGSHDDGAGCVQSMTVLQILKKLNYKPKSAIRVVLFMNEENGVKCGLKYEELSNLNKENYIFALGSDSGGFSPRGFSIKSDDENFDKINSWKKFLEPYLLHIFRKGNSGLDFYPLQ